REARLARAEVQARLGRGEPVLRTNRTLEEVGEEWLAAQHHLRPRTRQLYPTALDRHIYPRLGRPRIGEGNPDPPPPLSPPPPGLGRRGLPGWPVGGSAAPPGALPAYAAGRGLTPDTPIRRLERGERPRIVRREMRILRPDEIDALLTAAIPAYRPTLATAVF